MCHYTSTCTTNPNTLQDELFTNLRHRAIRMYQITGAKVAEYQHLIHSDGEETLETPKANRQRQEKTKTQHTFPCSGLCCALKRRDNPESGSTVRTASSLCSQCEQYNRSLNLCAKLEAHIVTCRKAQHRLAGRTSWPKEKITRRLMALDDILHIVQAWDKSKPQKDRPTLAKSRLVQDAFQMLTQSILRHPRSSYRRFDPPIATSTQRQLLQRIRQTICMCANPTTLPESIKPALCPTCNELRPHIRHVRRANRQKSSTKPTQPTCTLCGRLAPKPGASGHNP